jgi:hypothetical protein
MLYILKKFLEQDSTRTVPWQPRKSDSTDTVFARDMCEIMRPRSTVNHEVSHIFLPNTFLFIFEIKHPYIN